MQYLIEMLAEFIILPAGTDLLAFHSIAIRRED